MDWPHGEANFKLNSATLSGWDVREDDDNIERRGSFKQSSLHQQQQQQQKDLRKSVESQQEIRLPSNHIRRRTSDLLNSQERMNPFLKAQDKVLAQQAAMYPLHRSPKALIFAPLEDESVNMLDRRSVQVLRNSFKKRQMMRENHKRSISVLGVNAIVSQKPKKPENLSCNPQLFLTTESCELTNCQQTKQRTSLLDRQETFTDEFLLIPPAERPLPQVRPRRAVTGSIHAQKFRFIQNATNTANYLEANAKDLIWRGQTSASTKNQQRNPTEEVVLLGFQCPFRQPAHPRVKESSKNSEIRMKRALTEERHYKFRSKTECDDPFSVSTLLLAPQHSIYNAKNHHNQLQQSKRFPVLSSKSQVNSRTTATATASDIGPSVLTIFDHLRGVASKHS